MIWLTEILKTSDKVLRNKAYNIFKNPKYDSYQRILAAMVYKLFDKKTSGSGFSHTIKSIPQNEQLAEELHKPIIKKLKKKTRVHSAYKDNICGANFQICNQ